MKLIFVLIFSLISLSLEDMNCDIPMTIFIQEKENEEIEVEINCENINNESKITYSKEESNEIFSCEKKESKFICKINSTGIYDINFGNKKRKIIIKSDINDLFIVQKETNKSCYYRNEIIQYSLSLNSQSINISDIEFFALSQYPFSVIKKFEKNEKNNKIYYSLELNSLNVYKYDIVIYEKKYNKRYICLYETIELTDISLSKYFFPYYYKIEFIVNCDIKETSKFELKQNNKSIINFKCSDDSTFIDSNYPKKFICHIVFMSKLSDNYGNLELYYISDNNQTYFISTIFSSSSLSCLNFNFSKIDDLNYIITINDSTFYIDSIDSFEVEYGDDTDKHYINYKRDSLSDKLYFNEESKSFSFKLKPFNYDYKAKSIKRKMYFGENENDDGIYCNFSNIIIKKANLMNIEFTQKEIFIKEIGNDIEYPKFELKFDSNDLMKKYISSFCENIPSKDNEVIEATKKFNCIDFIDNKIIIYDERLFPGKIETEIKQITKKAHVYVSSLRIKNNCQNVYSEEYIQNVTVNYYFSNETRNNNNRTFIYYSALGSFRRLQPYYLSYIDYNDIENPTGINLNQYQINENEIGKESFLSIASQPEINISLSYFDVDIENLRNKILNKSIDEIDDYIKKLVYLCSNNDDCEKVDLYNYSFQNENEDLYIENICKKEKIKLDVNTNFNKENYIYYFKDIYYIISPQISNIESYIYFTSYQLNFPEKVYIENNNKSIEISVKNENNIIKENYYSITESGNYIYKWISNEKNEFKGETIIVKEKSSDFFNVTSSKKCLYYKNDKIIFNVTKSKEVNSDYIIISKTGFENEKLSCISENNCSFEISSDSSLQIGNIDIKFFTTFSKYSGYINYLYEDTIHVTDISNDNYTYSLKSIILNSLCFLDNFTIGTFKLNCDDTLLYSHRLNCRLNDSNNLPHGKYEIKYMDNIVSYIYYSNRISETNFNYSYNNSIKIGTNTIKITSEQFYIGIIERISINDNLYNYKSYTNKNKESTNYTFEVFYGNNSDDDYIELSFVAFPNRNYSIQLSDGEYSSKIYHFNKIEETVKFNFTNQIFIKGKSTELPKIIIYDAYFNEIDKIYYKNENQSEYINFISVEKSNTKSTIVFNNTNNGEYTFTYTFENDEEKNKYEIPADKIIIYDKFSNIINFIPLPDFHFINKDIEVDVEPLIDDLFLSVYLKDNNSNIFKFDNPYGHYFFLPSESLEIFKSKSLEFIIEGKFKDSNTIIYSQIINFYLIEGIKLYYYKNESIIINSIIDFHKIDLKSRNNNYTYLKKTYNNSHLTIKPPNNIIPGFYYLFLDGNEFEKVFFSDDLENGKFSALQSSESGTIVIKSNNYYLGNISTINIGNKVEQNETIGNSSVNYTFNDFNYNITFNYISFTHNNYSNYYIYLYNHDNKNSNVISVEKKALCYFHFNKSYQNLNDENEPLIFHFDWLYNNSLEQSMEYLYFDGNLKVIDEYKEKCELDYLQNISKCYFLRPKEYKVLTIKINNDELFIVNYTYFTFKMKSDECIQYYDNTTIQFYYDVPFNDDVFLLNERFNEPENSSYITTINQDEFGLYDINGTINNETVILKTIYYFPRISFVFFRDLINVKTNELDITVENNVFEYFKNLSFTNWLKIRNYKTGTIDEIPFNVSMTGISKNYIDLSDYGRGIYHFLFDDICNKKIDAFDKGIMDKDDQRIIAFYEDSINRNDYKEKEAIVLLLFNKKLGDDEIKNIYLIQENTFEKEIKFVKVNDTEVYVNFSLDGFDTGTYYFKVKYKLDEIETEYKCGVPFYIIDSLSIYEDYYIIYPNSSSLCDIGLIFNHELIPSYFKTIFIDNISLNISSYAIHNEFNNTLIIYNISCSTESEHEIKIGQTQSLKDVIVKYKVVKNFSETFSGDIMVNHEFYNTINNHSYIQIYAKEDVNLILVNDTKNLSKSWGNVFLLKYDLTDKNYEKFYIDYYKNDNLNKNNTKTVVVIKNIYAIFNNNINECQINYCTFENYNGICFPNLILNDNLLSSTKDLIYSFGFNDTEIRFNNSKDLQFTNGNKFQDKYYKFILKRKDKNDPKEFNLVETTFAFSNITPINLIKSYNEKPVIKASFKSLCYNENLIELENNLKPNDCSINNITNVLICDFPYNENKDIYVVLYEKNKIKEMKIIEECSFNFRISHLENGKKRYNISTNNNCETKDIKSITLNNDITKEINFENENAYVDIHYYKNYSEIFPILIHLSNSRNYKIEKDDSNTMKFDNYTLEFGYKKYSMTVLSHENKLEFEIYSTFSKIFLVKNSTEIYLNCSKGSGNKKNCSDNFDKLGYLYQINYYDVFLNTIKFNFEKQCYMNYEKIQVLIKTEVKQDFEIVLKGENKNNYNLTYKENKSNIYYYTISQENGYLNQGFYYLSINDSSFNNYKIRVYDNINIIKIVGSIFLNYDQKQYLYIELEKEILDKQIPRIKLNDNSSQTEFYCESFINSKKHIICILNRNIKNNSVLSFMNQCGDNQIEIKGNYYNLSHSMPKSIDIEFNILSNDFTIEFNGSDFKVNEIYIFKENLNKSLTFTKSDDKINLEKSELNFTGNYYLEIIFNSNDSIIIKLILYKSTFILRNNSIIYTTEKSLKDLKIFFKEGIDKREIKEIKLIHNDSNFDIQNMNNSEFNVSNNELTFSHDYNFKIGKSEMQIITINKIKLRFYIYYIKFPSNLKNQKAYYTEKKKKTIYFEFKNGGMKALREIIKYIEISNNNTLILYEKKNFTLDCNFENCSVKIPPDSINDYIKNIDDFETLIFDVKFYLDDEKKLNLSNLIEIHCFSIPYIENLIIVDYEKSYINEGGKHIIPIPDNDDIIPLIENGIISIDFPYTNNITIEKDSNNKTNLLIIDLNGQIDNSTNFTLIIDNDGEIKKILIYPFNCSKEGYFYLYDNGIILCIKCIDYNQDKPYKDLDNNECVNKCSKGYLYENRYQCYNSCSDVVIDNALLTEGDKCVLECSRNYGKKNNECVLCNENEIGISGICEYCSDSWCKELKYYSYIDPISSNCNDYKCENNGECYIKNDETYCKCKNGFYGFRCEITIESAKKISNIIIEDMLVDKGNYTEQKNDRVRIYFDEDGNFVYNLNNKRNKEQIREIINLIKNDDVFNSINKKIINNLFNYSSKMVDNILRGKIKDYNFTELRIDDIFEFIDLISIILIKNNTTTRLLSESLNGENNIKNRILELKDIATLLYKKITLDDINDEKFSDSLYDYSKNRYFYYQRWNKAQFSNLQNYIENNDELSIFELNNCNMTLNTYFLSITISSKINQLINNSEIPSTYIFPYDYSDDYLKDSNFECNNFIVYSPINLKYINLEKYKMFKKENIDIYNPYDEAFLEKCFITHNFDFDFTQKYRRTKIYENKTIRDEKKNCDYNGINDKEKKVVLNCKFEKNYSYTFDLHDEELNVSKKIDNLLPLKCFSKIDEKNLGFYFYLILNLFLLLMILYFIFEDKDCLKKSKKNKEKYAEIKINNDFKIEGIEKNIPFYDDNNLYHETTQEDLKNEEYIKVKKHKNDKNMSEKLSENNQHVLDEFLEEDSDKKENKSDINSLKDKKDKNKENNSNSIKDENKNKKNNDREKIINNNLIHPLDDFDLIIDYEDEDYLDILYKNLKSIYEKPNEIKKEEKILIICFIFCKLFILLGCNALFYFENFIEKRIFNKERNLFYFPIKAEFATLFLSIIMSTMINIIKFVLNKKIKNKMKMKMIITMVILTIIDLFCLIYSISFCSIYKHTQITWFLGFIWSIIFEIIFTLVYIVIISFIEFKYIKKKDSVVLLWLKNLYFKVSNDEINKKKEKAENNNLNSKLIMLSS